MRTLLIVDDERTIRQGLAGSLAWETIGIGSVLTAANGAIALELLHKQPIDIVLTDIVMPEMTGLELVEASRAARLKPTFIIMSSYDDFEYVQTALRNQVEDYLLKPSNPEELQKILVKVIAKIKKQEEALRAQQAAESHYQELLPHATRLLFEQVICQQERLAENSAFFALEDTPYRLLYLSLPEEKAKELQLSLQKEPLVLVPAYIYREHQLILLCADKPETSLFSLANRLTEEVQITLPVIISEAFALGQGEASYRHGLAVSQVATYLLPQKIGFARDIILNEAEQPALVSSFSGELRQALIETDLPKALRICRDLFVVFQTNLTSFRRARDSWLTIALFLQTDNTPKEPINHTILPEMENIYNITQLGEFATAFLGQLFFSYKGKTASSRSQNPTFIRMLAHIEAHLGEERLSLKMIGEDILFMNPDYLGKLFRRESGMKFNDYLLAMRMQKAVALFTKEPLLVYEVAEQVGYGDNPNYFTQLFRQYTGKSPSEYRKTQQK